MIHQSLSLISALLVSLQCPVTYLLGILKLDKMKCSSLWQVGVSQEIFGHIFDRFTDHTYVSKRKICAETTLILISSPLSFWLDCKLDVVRIVCDFCTRIYKISKI